MISKLKSFVLNLLVGANIVTILLMLVAGYSDRLSPAEHPYLACAGMVFPIFLLVNLLFVPLWVLLSWHRLVVLIIGLALAYVPIRTYIPLHKSSAPPDNALTIVSYNVCTFGGNYKYDNGVDTIFNYLKTYRPDILCLQEDKDIKRNELEKKMRTMFAYMDTTMVSDKTFAGVNLIGFYSRYPILKKEVINYNSPTNGSVAYFIKMDKDTVLIINNHLESSHLSKEDRNRYQDMIEGDMQRDTMKSETNLLIRKLTEGMKARAGHVDIIHEYVEAHRQYPIIICGDFNDTPISYARHKMAEGLTDCFVESGCGFGISFNRKGFPIRIDHMMCSSEFIPLLCEIDNKMDASDHYPLICWLKKKEKP